MPVVYIRVFVANGGSVKFDEIGFRLRQFKSIEAERAQNFKKYQSDMYLHQLNTQIYGHSHLLGGINVRIEAPFKS